MTALSGKHRYEVRVDPDDIDHMGHVNNAVYLTWVQRAVVAHWESRAPLEALQKIAWVALKHEIDYRRPAFLGDGVIVETVAERLFGVRAFFTTLITRGETVLAEVKSSWCSLDSETHRPVRVARNVRQLFFGRDDRSK